MEERLLNEKESLALITQMINSSKKNMEIGQGNYLLIWGLFHNRPISHTVCTDHSNP